jgi:hypothetical protein
MERSDIRVLASVAGDPDFAFRSIRATALLALAAYEPDYP